jgi:hypothetical protein
MSRVKLLVFFVLILGLAFSGACTAVKTTLYPPGPISTVPGTFLPPAFWDIETTITNTPTAVNVSFLARTIERADSATASVIYYFDTDPPTAPGQSAFSPSGTYYVATSLDQSYLWKNVTPGRHTFSAQLVNANDNTPFSPAVVVKNTINVPSFDSTAPEISRMSCIVNYPNPVANKTTAETVTPLQVQITASVHHFRLNDDAVGKQDVSGDGHYIYYLDVEPLTTPGLTATTLGGTSVATTDDFLQWTNLGAGTHTFFIQVVNNDNTPLDPSLTGSFIITLPAQL